VHPPLAPPITAKATIHEKQQTDLTCDPQLFAPELWYAKTSDSRIKHISLQLITYLLGTVLARAATEYS
jgi:hypothetical protein